MRVLVISRGPAGSRRSAPGIRARAMARVLAEQLPGIEVTLAVPDHPDLPDGPYFTERAVGARLSDLARRQDVVISMGLPLVALPAALSSHFVLDYFANFYVEWMLGTGRAPAGLRRRARRDGDRWYLNLQLTLADYILCATESQRDAYLGALAGLGLIYPDSFRRDHSLRALIDVAPHGVRFEPSPTRDRSWLQQRIPGLSDDEPVLLWNSGIVEWYDPRTAIRATGLLRAEGIPAHLVFVGGPYPGGDNTGAHEHRAAARYADELGLLDTAVHFLDGWLPYREVPQVLAGADLAVCTWRRTLEARYALRTRYLDLLWARVPLIATAGDPFGDLMASRGALAPVPEDDATAVARACAALLADRERRAAVTTAMATLADELRWERTLAPLVRHLSGGARPTAMPKHLRLPGMAARLTGTLAWRAVDAVGRWQG